ncbi:MAG TPA: hypothetical protein VHE61_24270 [Opitutaceae bacterium]|nr:hypothetical protein [Opitutaceae bacterium]
MKISELLATRQALLRQTQLANLAYAYSTLHRLATRITRANLRGLVRLLPAEPAEERFWATLIALEGNQSVIEEHFGDQEIIELADAIAFATDGEFSALEFRLEELGDQFLPPLRHVLQQAGVELDLVHEQANLAPDGTD